MNTEKIYDEKMEPLVAQLIGIAREHGIPLLVHAALRQESGEVIGCLTQVPGDLEARDLDGARNRHGLSGGIVRGHAGFDTAAGLAITRHHPT
jgi:hypothetical protein